MENTVLNKILKYIKEMNYTFLGMVGVFVVLLVYFYKQNNVNHINELFFQDTPLMDSDLDIEQYPELLLPISQDNSNMGSGKKYKPIDVYISNKKIGFKRSEIEQVFGEQLRKFKKIPKEIWEQEEYGVAKFMVPILWKTINNQYKQFKTLTSDIKKIKTELHEANLKMLEIKDEATKISE